MHSRLHLQCNSKGLVARYGSGFFSPIGLETVTNNGILGPNFKKKKKKRTKLYQRGYGKSGRV